MTKATLVAVLMLVIQAQAASSSDTDKRISDEALRHASARLYSEIVFRACLNGKRYFRSQIEKGFARHAAEMRLQLFAQGYIIVPGEVTNFQPRQSANLAIEPQPDAPKFGCRRPYWLDD